MDRILYSIVVPMRDEEDHVEPLVEEIECVMKELGSSWELLCVDDASSDATQVRLCHLQRTKPFLKVLRLARPAGQSSALAAGFAAAQGESIVTLDGDRQNDPKDIPKLLAALTDCDLVCGYRTHRQDHLSRRIISSLANALRKRICKDGIDDSGCGLKVCRSACLKQIPRFDGMHRFLPALFQIEGFRVRQLPVTHRPREGGSSKVRLRNRFLGPIIDLCAVYWLRRRRLHDQVVG